MDEQKLGPLDRAGAVTIEIKRNQPLSDGILNLIWHEQVISRADIARQTGLAKSTVSENISFLLKSGLVQESGIGVSGGGRQPILLSFQDEACCVLGVEIGARHVAVTLTDLRGKVLVWSERSFPARTDPVGTRRLVLELCADCVRSRPSARTQLVGIGVAVPSPVNPESPQRLSEIVMPAWQGQLGLEQLTREYDVPLFVDNDANLGALAEFWWGAGRGNRDFIYIKSATGIGAGYILDGRIYKGGSGFAGEIGHLSIDPEGLDCICGLKGCLVTRVGLDAVLARARELLAHDRESTLNGSELSVDALAAAAHNGDRLARQVIEETADSFSVAIAGLLNALNPRAVIIGGSLASLGVLLLEPLGQAIRNRMNISTNQLTEIKVSELGTRSVAIGAATQVIKEALANPRLFPTLNKAEA